MIHVSIEKTPAGEAAASTTVSLKLPAEASLRHKRQTLEYFWQQGATGRSLLRKHTELIDAQLALNFANCSEAAEDFSLVALGGYGRCELFPFSDIDLLLLYAPAVEEKVKRVAEAILYPLWDAGLEVGHGVRTPAACLADAEADYFFQVALLDSRLVAGSPTLFTELREQFEAKFIQGRRAEFCDNMQAHRIKRHERFGAHSYMLEPHIKECRGGLRDIQAMLWTARAIFGLAGIEAMEEAGLLTAVERGRFEEAWERLITIRNRLHYVSGRKNDRLYFEHQEEMAKAFNYRNRDGFLAVEHFMRDVYSAMHTVAVAANLFFEHTDEVLGRGAGAGQDRLLAPGLELRAGRIHVSEAELADNKALLLKTFSHAARTGAGLHHRSRRLIRDNLGLVDERFRHSRRLARLFLHLLAEAKEPLAVLEALHETELLTAYIPEFGEVRSLAQHDVYHIYTVDIHLLHTVAELHRLKTEMPQIFQEVKNPAILYLAGLLHDIGKGHGQGHAERGGEMVAAIGRRLGCSTKELDCLVFLVRQHLFLSHIALRRDLEDEEFLLRCARQIKGLERLAMLYLLSVADARATGPDAWNVWKAALLLELYLKIAHLLETDIAGAPPDRRQGAEWMRQELRRLLGEAPAVDVAALPDDYLLCFPPATVAGHIENRGRLKDQPILVFPEKRQDCWSILIMTHDQPGLLAKICGVLALHNLQILAAQIFTWPDGTVVDTLDLASLVGEAYANQDWEAFSRDLARVIEGRVGLEHRLSRKPLPPGHGLHTPTARRPAQVIVDNDTSERYTVIEVYSDDRAGLLYEITRTLTDFGINIFRAKIGSRADQVVGVFYVLELSGGKISDSTFQQEVRQELLYVVSTNRPGDRTKTA